MKSRSCRFLADPNTGFWLLVASGVLSSLYNYWSIGLSLRDNASWTDWNLSVDPILDVLSIFIPIIHRIPDQLVAAGYQDRATLVRHLYGMDWGICLPFALLAVPSFIGGASRASKNITAGKVSYLSLSKMQFERAGVLLLVIVIVTWDESWFGSLSFDGNSIYFNHVFADDYDLYRVCVFAPLSLVFLGLATAVAVLNWRYRPKD